jgi:hypothetical protein
MFATLKSLGLNRSLPCAAPEVEGVPVEPHATTAMAAIAMMAVRLGTPVVLLAMFRGSVLRTLIGPSFSSGLVGARYASRIVMRTKGFARLA